MLTLKDGAFVIGGQALNIWAERYHSKADELRYYGPYTSKDLDYFGQKDAARKLADAIGGKVLVPSANDHSPESARVVATIDGHNVEVDFLTHVKGVPDDRLQQSAADLNFEVKLDGDIVTLKVPIMHPFHCLSSRVASVIELGRKDDTAKRQLEAVYDDSYVGRLTTVASPLNGNRRVGPSHRSSRSAFAPISAVGLKQGNVGFRPVSDV